MPGKPSGLASITPTGGLEGIDPVTDLSADLPAIRLIARCLGLVETDTYLLLPASEIITQVIA